MALLQQPLQWENRTNIGLKEIPEQAWEESSNRENRTNIGLKVSPGKFSFNRDKRENRTNIGLKDYGGLWRRQDSAARK